jgi:alkylation response protein AidB-like acyl-CoA dehydrogenase
MNFGFTEEQELLRSEVRKLLDTRCPLDEVRRIAETPEGFSRDLWKQIGELGWLGLTVPESYGGAGLGWVDQVVLLEETGRTLFPSPLVSHLLATGAIAHAGDAAQQGRLLPALADGSRIGTVALLEASDVPAAEGIALRGARDGAGFRLSGEKRFVGDAGAADLFVVAFRTGDARDEIALAVVERGARGVLARDFPGVDRTKRAGTLALADVRVASDALLGAPRGAGAALARLFECGAVAVTAEALGAAERAVEITTRFARERIQFGEPIGRFQAVKHPLAEMHVDVESAKSLLYYAAWALDGAPHEAGRYASMAKAYASEAFRRIGIDGVQLHGAVGYTAEYDIQLYLKRSKWASQAFGAADWHYDRLAAQGDD